MPLQEQDTLVLDKPLLLKSMTTSVFPIIHGQFIPLSSLFGHTGYNRISKKNQNSQACRPEV